MAVLAMRMAPETTLLEEAQDALEASRDEVRQKVRRWLLYYGREGYTKLHLEECPGLRGRDLREAAVWLTEEGFRVEVPRWGFWGRVVVHLEGENDVDGR